MSTLAPKISTWYAVTMNDGVNPSNSIKHRSVKNVSDLRLLARRNFLVLLMKQYARTSHLTDGKVDFGVRMAELAHVERELAKRRLLRVAVTLSGKAALLDPPVGDSGVFYGQHKRAR